MIYRTPLSERKKKQKRSRKTHRTNHRNSIPIGLSVIKFYTDFEILLKKYAVFEIQHFGDDNKDNDGKESERILKCLLKLFIYVVQQSDIGI